MIEDPYRALMAANPPVVGDDDVKRTMIYFDWGWKGCGFGQLHIDYDRETGKFSCDAQGMSQASVEKIIDAFVVHLKANLILES